MSLRSALALGLSFALGSPAFAGTLYVGTYTNAGSRGIYALSFDDSTGALGRPRLAAATANPSFMILSPAGDRMYAANELGMDKGGGGLSSFAIENGLLRELSRQPSRGGDPCDLTLSHDGRMLFASNYGTGSIAALPVTFEGKLEPASQFFQFTGSGPNPTRQQGPHAHCVVMDPGGRHLLVCDLGTDLIRVFRYDESNGVLSEAPSSKMAPGSGPRHLIFAPSGRTAYLISEMASTVTALHWDPDTARLTPFQTLSTLPAGFASHHQTAAEIQIDSAGRFLYASNRGDNNSLAVYAVAEDGSLTLAQQIDTGGRIPRHFALDPSEHFVAVALQNSNLIRIFRRDPASGRLTPTDASASLSRPVCVLFAR